MSVEERKAHLSGTFSSQLSTKDKGLKWKKVAEYAEFQDGGCSMSTKLKINCLGSSYIYIFHLEQSLHHPNLDYLKKSLS